MARNQIHICKNISVKQHQSESLLHHHHSPTLTLPQSELHYIMNLLTSEETLTLTDNLRSRNMESAANLLGISSNFPI